MIIETSHKKSHEEIIIAHVAGANHLMHEPGMRKHPGFILLWKLTFNTCMWR